ncbi:phosphatase PAP2 family protein [Enhygromyxa salina]|uniref:phosphatase PAP2 family protein n=1 Tax=Enhygromyxa salina TaxID=215803 RepID=UPI003555D0A7
MWALSLVLLLCCYAVGKLSAVVFEPHVLPLTSLDRAVPFVPWTVWLYGTITWVSLIAWLTIPTRADGARLMTTILIASATCALVFVLVPTSFPRELYPLTELDSASARELARVRDADSPTNCLPSLHVALAWGIALTWADTLKRRTAGGARAWRWIARGAPLVWAATISVTTLTTKQHFVVDVPSGMIVGGLAWCLVGGGQAVRWRHHHASLGPVRGPHARLGRPREGRGQAAAGGAGLPVESRRGRLARGSAAAPRPDLGPPDQRAHLHRGDRGYELRDPGQGLDQRGSAGALWLLRRRGAPPRRRPAPGARAPRRLRSASRARQFAGARRVRRPRPGVGCRRPAHRHRQPGVRDHAGRGHRAVLAHPPRAQEPVVRRLRQANHPRRVGPPGCELDGRPRGWAALSRARGAELDKRGLE